MSSPSGDDIRRAYRLNVWKMYAYRATFLLHFYGPVFVIFLRGERGLSYPQIALLDGLFWVAILVAEVPTGAIADRIGRRYSIALGCALWAVALLVLGLAEPFWLLLAAALVWGASTSLQSGADQALLYDSLLQSGEEERYERIKGREVFFGWGALLVATATGPLLSRYVDASFPFVCTAIAAVVAGAIIMTTREPPAQLTPREPYATIIRSAIAEVRRNRPVSAMVAFSALLWCAAYVPMFFVQPFLTDNGAELSSLGLWQALLRLAGMLGALGAFAIAARVGRREALLAMPFLLVVAYAVVGGSDALWAFPLLLAPRLVEGVSGPLISGYLNDRIESDRRATVLSLQSFASGLVTFVVLQGAGLLAEETGLRWVFYLGVLLAVAAACGGLWWRRADLASAPTPAAA